MSTGRQKKYRTPEALERAVRAYFASISASAPVREEYDTGEKDEYGHAAKDFRDVKNGAGEVVRRTAFIVPPTVSGLCLALGIHRSTWYAYQDYPGYSEVYEWARLNILAYLEDQLLSRKGSDIQGVKFLLQAGYGMSECKTLELGAAAAKAVMASGMSRNDKLKLIEDLRMQADMESDPMGPQTEPNEAGSFGRGGAAE